MAPRAGRVVLAGRQHRGPADRAGGRPVPLREGAAVRILAALPVRAAVEHAFAPGALLDDLAAAARAEHVDLGHQRLGVATLGVAGAGDELAEAAVLDD